MKVSEFKCFTRTKRAHRRKTISESYLTEDLFCYQLYGEIQNSGTCGWYVKRSHLALESNLPKFDDSCDVLELGCNLGEHSSFVKHPYATYKSTDYRFVDFTPINSRIMFEVADAQNLDYSDNSFDRVIMTCVLHHLPNLISALDEMRRVAKNSAVISILLPTDPGLLYRIGKSLGPYRSARKLSPSFDSRYFHYQQHQNHFPGLQTMIDHVFRSDSIREIRWLLPWRFWNLNLFCVFQIRVKK